MRSKQVPLAIVGSTKFARYKKQSIEATYNMIISDNGLVPFAGHKKQLVIQPGNTSGREVYRSVKSNHMIIVVGADVFWLDTNLSLGLVGQLDTETGNVFITENNANQIAIVDGLNVYIFNIVTETFQTISVPFSPVYIDFQDTYFIAADGNSNQWLLSGQNDGTNWSVTNASQVGELQTKPDIMVAVVRFDRQLFVMGTKTTEIWHDLPQTASQLFPYQRDNSLSIDYGCLNAATIATGFGLLVWLAGNEKAGPTIRVSRGGAPEELSTDGINFILDKLEFPSDASAFLFEEDGHVFYLITFFSDNVSYVYDFNTNKFFNVTDYNLNHHIAKRITFFNDTHYFISVNDGCLYELSTDFTTFIDDIDGTNATGKEIPRIRITPPYRKELAQRFPGEQLSLTMEQGNTREERVVDLSISRDGGQSFGSTVRNQVRPLPFRQNRMDFYQLGSANDWTFQFRFWGRERFVIVGGQFVYREPLS